MLLADDGHPLKVFVLATDGLRLLLEVSGNIMKDIKPFPLTFAPTNAFTLPTRTESSTLCDYNNAILLPGELETWRER